MTTTQQLDLALINGYLEVLDLEVIQQMLDLYRQQSILYLTGISAAIDETNDNTWQEQCHKMKGAAASAGLCQVHQKLIAIEKTTEAWQVRADHLSALALLNQQAIDTFKQWLDAQ